MAIWASREFQKSEAYAEAESRPKPAEELPAIEGPQVVMTYFLVGTRCVSCKKIEALARETAEQDFAAELAANRLVFRVIDTGEPANRHYLDDYKLTSKTVVISRRIDGKETTWKDMENVWELFDDAAAFVAHNRHCAPLVPALVAAGDIVRIDVVGDQSDELHTELAGLDLLHFTRLGGISR